MERNVRIFLFYSGLITGNKEWIKRISLWALFCFLAGGATFIVRPELLPAFGRFLDEVFKDLLGEKELDLNFATVLLIFKNNLVVATLSLFLGVVFGLIPIFSAAVNFFILGFLFAVFTASNPLIFLVSIVPHGIVEIPALILTAAFGLRLGWEFKSLKQNLFQNLTMLPLLVCLFFIAALVEVFITGNLINEPR